MSSSNKPPRYHAYLLRFWQERSQPLTRLAAWRFSLEDPHTGERRGFADLEKLVAFLKSEAGEPESNSPQDSGSPPP